MKTHHCLKAAAAACTLALVSCGASSQLDTTSVPVSSTSASATTSLSGSVHQAVNAYRRSHGAQELRRHPGLDRLAQEHAEFLRKNRGKFDIYGKNVSHYGFEGRSLAARQKFNIHQLGENVAAGNGNSSNPAPMLVKMWAGSKNHAHNMRTAWTHTGVGVVVDSDGMVFATQLFGTINQSQLALTDRFRQF